MIEHRWKSTRQWGFRVAPRDETLLILGQSLALVARVEVGIDNGRIDANDSFLAQLAIPFFESLALPIPHHQGVDMEQRYQSSCEWLFWR